MTNKDTYDIEAYEKEKELEFRNYKNPTPLGVKCIPLHDWIDEYNFQQENTNFPFSFDSKPITIKVWSCTAYYELENKTYQGMYAYAEVIAEQTGEFQFKSLFGEESVDACLRWALDVSNNMLYKKQ